MEAQRVDATGVVIRWALSAPVLTWRLRIIAEDGVECREHGRDEELSCTVTDLLDPDRGPMWECYLRTVGADPVKADAVWKELSGVNGVGTVCWQKVRDALLGVDLAWARECGD